MFPSESNLDKLSGIVKRITFHSPESGWSVLKIDSFNHPEEVTVTVHQSKVFAGATMDFYGNWTNHPKFGPQFKAEKVVEKKPATTNALEKYLGSGLIKGVGPKTATKIVKHFKDQTLEIFDTSIQRLTEVPGIANQKLQMIQKAWQEHKEIKNVMIFLQSYDISTLFAVKIYKTYGEKAITIVSDNPYKLAEDIYGIGFFSADKIALKMGLEKLSLARIKAAISHVLASSREEGHCYLTKEQIRKTVPELLQISDHQEIETCQNLVETELDSMKETQELKTRILDETECYYSPSLFYDEQLVATKVSQLIQKPIKFDTERGRRWLSKYFSVQKIQLSPEQQEAVLKIAGSNFSILTGGPGCGKTTTTKTLVMMLKAMGKKIALAAPTGRAAQRMTEVIGIQSKTVHRLLQWQPDIAGFSKNQENPLEEDFLIVDETSMLDIHLAAALLRSVGPDTQVLWVGDKDQLPSVGAGNVLGDLIESHKVPTFALTKIFRQGKESLIIEYAHQINRGIVPEIPTPFQFPHLWTDQVDCLFIDSQEATVDQTKFVGKVRYLSEKGVKYNLNSEDQNSPVPKKYSHVNLENLIAADSRAKELIELSKTIPPYSSLHYGLSASQMVERLYQQIIPKYYPNQEIQILSPMTRGSLGTQALNSAIQQKTNPPAPGKSQLTLGNRIFRVGDRVIQKVNNYDLEVFNGDIGKISDINSEDLTCTVNFPQGSSCRSVLYQHEDLNQIDLAYAITIHKSQGSEFGCLILPITPQHFTMLFRNLIYTGLTRAKKLCVFVGSRQALTLAIKNQDTKSRQSALKHLLLSNSPLEG